MRRIGFGGLSKVGSSILVSGRIACNSSPYVVLAIPCLYSKVKFYSHNPREWVMSWRRIYGGKVFFSFPRPFFFYSFVLLKVVKSFLSLKKVPASLPMPVQGNSEMKTWRKLSFSSSQWNEMSKRIPRNPPHSQFRSTHFLIFSKEKGQSKGPGRKKNQTLHYTIPVMQKASTTDIRMVTNSRILQT